MITDRLKRILIIEDELIIREMTAELLEDEGYDVKTAADGKNGLYLAESFQPDLILLDLGLPDIDGAMVAKRLKKNNKTKHILIMVLSARNDDLDVVTGLESYADEYLTKPYKDKMLTARLKAVLRRNEPKEKIEQLEVGGIVLDALTFTVATPEGNIILSKTEFEILYVFAKNPNRVYSRGKIISFSRGEGYPVTDRAVDMHIARLRKKLGKRGCLIETVRGIGYRLTQN
ncbi:response regulator transcription factor [Shewanella sp. VB17]|uniref:response regulator transcription factor n=1 Tax=Shewanella sp. VB17 TaxID=2739432 RepID=UPI0015643EC7|nr:response regulator transcription factor [Shewanella sp. VB17]NRD72794.1 response regulator transcription factor [Shewanella sp. VB17]